MITRRSFCGLAPLALFSADTRYRVGITTNTRGGWEKDVFLSFREARRVGYRNVESFFHYFQDYLDRPADLKKQIDDIGVRFVTISNGAPMEMHFEDPSRHTRIVEEHARLARFIREFGCTHLKINMGPRRPEGTTAKDLDHMSAVLNRVGKATAAEGIRLAVHAHMWSQFENQSEIDFVLSHTDPALVAFVLDTGHITMAGIDPVVLARKQGHRIVEFHLKDTDPVHRGGAKVREAKHDPMNQPLFFPLGRGGVDFPALKSHLDSISWKGWLTVELDSSPARPPMESARMSANYLTGRLKIPLA